MSRMTENEQQERFFCFKTFHFPISHLCSAHFSARVWCSGSVVESSRSSPRVGKLRSSDVCFSFFQTFKREKNDLFINHKIGLVEALCGFQFTLKHLDGRQIVIKYPAGKVIEPGPSSTLTDLNFNVFTVGSVCPWKIWRQNSSSCGWSGVCLTLCVLQAQSGWCEERECPSTGTHSRRGICTSSLMSSFQTTTG